MAGRWRDPAAFRADPNAAPALRPTRRQSVALLTVLVLVAGAIAAASYLLRPDKARAFDLLHGSLFLADIRGPVAVDLASAKPTVRINDANVTVGAAKSNDISVVPLDSGTLLVNSVTGEFNMIDSTGFVVKHNGGVRLPEAAGQASAVGVAAGDLGYVVQTGTGGTSVYLVSETTVQTALSATATVKPRAFRTMSAPTSTAPGATASANGDLWLLAGTGPSRTIRQLSLPPDSSTGVTLRSVDHGTVSGTAAIGTAHTSAGDVVGVASSDRITVFGPGGKTPLTVGFPAQAGVSTILPTTEASDRLTFLLHGTSGWSIVSVAADGSDLRGPSALQGVGAGATLAEPAESRGSLYTMDMGQTGTIFKIDGTTAGEVDGARSYPLATQDGRVIEPGGFADAYVIARGSRVILNSPGHREALAVFTDGSRAPLEIEKGAGVPVSAAGGAEALAQSRLTPPTKPGTPPSNPGKQPTKNPPPAQPGTNKLDCKTTAQKPHIPVILPPVAGSRSVQLQWNYPLIDSDDCKPSTYVVSVKLVTNGRPQPRGSVTVQGQTGINLTGLYPSTQYQITVAAYIGGLGTSSLPQLVTTGKEGPAAPTNVRVSADNGGNWHLSWASCGTVQQNCVPAADWQVIPKFCDGIGVANPPPPKTVPADPTSKAQPPAVYAGGDDLLGRGLSFEIEGTGVDGTAGTPSAGTPCVHSWSPPVGAAMTLTASSPANTSLNGTTTTTVALDLGANATHNVGGVGAQITFHLAGPGGTQTQGPITYTGKSTHVAVTFPGIRAGASYSASAVVSPPGHPGAAVTLTASSIATRADWPAMSLSAACPRDSGLGLSCTLSVTIGGLSSAQAQGEKFDLTSDSRLQCGATTEALSETDFDPATTTITLNNVSQLQDLFGHCTVYVGLVENANDPSPKVFGGTVSPTLSKDLDLGAPARAGIGQGDLTVSWNSQGGASNVGIHYTGDLSGSDIAKLTQNWSEAVTAPGGAGCGSAAQQPDVNVQVSASCVNQFGGTTDNWTVAVSYTDATDGKKEGPFTYQLPGPPPTYQPCNPAAFTATWGATIAAGVTVTYTGTDPRAIAGCSNWSYTLQDDNGKSCGTPDNPPNPPNPSVIMLSCNSPPAAGWTVHITYVDTAGNKQAITPDVDVGGTPPTS